MGPLFPCLKAEPPNSSTPSPNTTVLIWGALEKKRSPTFFTKLPSIIIFSSLFAGGRRIRELVTLSIKKPFSVEAKVTLSSGTYIAFKFGVWGAITSARTLPFCLNISDKAEEKVSSSK